MERIIFLLFFIVSIPHALVLGQTTTIYRNGTTKSAETSKQKFAKVSKSFDARSISEIHILKNKFRNLDIRIGAMDSIRIIANMPARHLSSDVQSEQWKNTKITTRTEAGKFFIEPILSTDRIPMKGGATTLKAGDSNVLFNKSLRKNMSEESITVYVPQNFKIIIDSEFSDVRVENRFSQLFINCNNCFVSVTDIKFLKGDIKYSDLLIEKIDSLDLSIKFGTLGIARAQVINVRSNLTEMKLGNIESFKLNSLNDEIDIDMLGSMVGSQENGQLRIKKFDQNLDFKGNGCDLTIEQINPKFKNFNVSNKFANVSIAVAGLTDYKIIYLSANSTLFAPFELRKGTIENKPVDVYQIGNGKSIINLSLENCKTFLK